LLLVIPLLKRRGGGQQAGIGPAAAAKCGPAAGLLVFLVGAVLLALVGLAAETGVVETQGVVAAALGRPRGGEQRRPVFSLPDVLRPYGEGDLREFRK
jgi:hypothetical protein